MTPIDDLYGRRRSGPGAAPGAATARKTAAVLALLVALVLVVPAGCARGPLDGVPTLSVGPVPEVRRPQVDQKFHQATVVGHTYTLPCLGSEFLDNGWAPGSDDLGPVAAHGAVSIELVMDGMRLWLSLRNDRDGPVPWEQAQVVGIMTDRGLSGPTPEIQPGTTKEDVVALLGAPDLDDEKYRGAIVYYGLPFQSARLLDIGMRPPFWDFGDILGVGDTILQLDLFEGRYVRFELYIDAGEPFDPNSTRAGDDVKCVPDSDEHAYSYRLHEDFFLGETSSSRPVEYVIDGEAYVFGVSYFARCNDIDPDKSSAQKIDDYLLAPMLFYEDSDTESRLSRSEPFLLWDRDDSSAAVMVYRGEGELTGDEYVEVSLNYCDWENGFQIRMSFSVISVEKGVTVSKGAESHLLSMVSEVAESVTKTQ